MKDKLLKFGSIGVLCLLIDNTIVYIASINSISPTLARTITFFFTLIISYFLNCKFTFLSKISLRTFFLFFSGVGFINFLSYLMSLLFLYLWPGLNPIFALNFSAVTFFIINFIFQRKIFAN
jgi:putative flippase GtrA